MKNDLLNDLRSNLDGLKYRSKKAQEKLKKPSVSYSISSCSQRGGQWESAIIPMGFGKVVARTFSPITEVYSYRPVVYNLSKLTMTLSSYGSHKDFDARKLKELKKDITYIEDDGEVDERSEQYSHLKEEAAKMELLPHFSEESKEAFFSLPEMMEHLGLVAKMAENYEFLIAEKVLNLVVS